MNSTFEEALDAVATAESKSRFELGQPVWAIGDADQSCYIIIGFSRSIFGPWIIEVVREMDPTGPAYHGQESWFTSEPPRPIFLHPDHAGTIYFTSNGVPLKCIRHECDR